MDQGAADGTSTALLIETDLTVDLVARRVGDADPAYFVRTFRRVTPWLASRRRPIARYERFSVAAPAMFLVVARTPFRTGTRRGGVAKARLVELITLGYPAHGPRYRGMRAVERFPGPR
jgi:hypothetical protein